MPPKRAYATLLTRPSYLPGALVLAYTLRKHASQYPLLVLVTPSLGATSLLALERANEPLLRVHPVSPLLPSASQLPSGAAGLIASRFEDTWTKLRVFELEGYDEICFLDADIGVFGQCDEVFEAARSLFSPGSEARRDGRWLAATHACVCNLDGDGWADADWRLENCAHHTQRHPGALQQGPRVPSSQDVQREARLAPQTLLNGGVFVFAPSKQLWGQILQMFETSAALKNMKFPDQDFMALFFQDRWRALPWRFNALKTMRYWHENLWRRDEDVVCLHYIVDKPWGKRVATDGVAGHLGRDGVTHGWWWKLWEEWLDEAGAGREGMRRRNDAQLMECLDGLVEGPLDEEADRRQVEENEKERLPVAVPDHPR